MISENKKVFRALQKAGAERR